MNLAGLAQLADILFGVLTVMTLGYVPLLGFLVWQAWKKPRIRALSFLAGLVGIIAIYVVIRVAAIANAKAGYLAPEEYLQVAARLALIPLGLYPYLVFLAYRRRWFIDSPTDDDTADSGDS